MSLSRSLFRPVLLCLLGCVPLSASAGQGRYREQDAARAARLSGQAMPLRVIEERIVPRMQGADYLGPEYDAGSSTYRLKFMRGGSVIWLDVDARTGQVVRKSGD